MKLRRSSPLRDGLFAFLGILGLACCLTVGPR